MNVSSDAAGQIVGIYLDGIKVAATITGSGAKDIAALLYAIMKDNKKTAGKTKLSNMLKSGKELKVFSIKKEDFKKFASEAKNYGVLYSALIDKKSKDNTGIIDIMVRVDDASRINRIVEKFKLASFDETSIRGSIEKNKSTTLESGNEKSNPSLAMTKSPQSKPSSKTSKTLDQGTRTDDRESIKQKIEKAKVEANNRNNSKVKSKSNRDVTKNDLRRKER